ncbi:MAG: hypothetical protein V7K21_20205 [Nostoc sp.]|uniref:hypothetical protein n=1 Tax=Nostoc sp. TaxID=1180 RepID=UPI002FFD15E5
MKINNAQLISLLFDEPELRSLLSETKPYISRLDGQTILHLRCLRLCTLKTLLQYRQELTQKLQPLLNFEICLECEETGVDNSMVTVAEKLTNVDSTGTETRFLSLDILVRATNKTPVEVKKLLGVAKEVIHPTEDGAEMITEAAFNGVVLQWAQSLKNDATSFNNGGTSENQDGFPLPPKPPKPSTPRRAKTKILASKLTFEDIIKTKTGKKVNMPNLTQKGVQETLENFFKKVNIQDTSNVDVISAFIEGTSEFGISLRKELLSAYELFTKEPNIQEVQERLVEGAKVMLESMAAAANQE